ncbi:hypothetical protein HMPREF0290_2284 [Corynebacterium efficiens YS-314]|nr:hypothetical protein HMPREF0290_2284 [Corynebacterium efficiens YS-314]
MNFLIKVVYKPRSGPFSHTHLTQGMFDMPSCEPKVLPACMHMLFRKWTTA